MLFSATLTRSPARLAALHLQRPRFFCVAGAKYATPATLREWMLVCSAPEKPMLLVLLLRWLRDGGSADACATAAGISDGEGRGTPAAGSGGVDGNDDGASQTLVFTSSVDATHRLTRLLQLFGFPDAVEYSGSLAHKQRRAVLGGMRSARRHQGVRPPRRPDRACRTRRLELHASTRRGGAPLQGFDGESGETLAPPAAALAAPRPARPPARV